MEPRGDINLFDLQVDHHAAAYIKDTTRWAKFLAIVGFVMSGIFLIIFIYYVSTLLNFNTARGEGHPPYSYYSGITLLTYLLMAILSFFPCLYLLRFASRMQRALRNNDQEELNDSFRNLRACLRFVGILTVISLGLMITGIIFTIIDINR